MGEHTTPISCDMSAAADTPQERIAEYGRLFGTALIGRERTAGGIAFRFRDAAGVEAWVRDLAAREKACCAFFTFTVTRRGGEVRWDAGVVDDDTARAVLEEFYELPRTAAEGAGAVERRFTARGLRLLPPDGREAPARNA